MLHRVAAAILTVATGTVVLTAPVAARVLLERAPATPSTATEHPAATPLCGAEPTTAAAWQHLFASQTGAWAGADGAASLRLPDGRMLWLFGDTFVGDVRRDGSRSDATRIVRNSVVVTDGSCVRPLPTRTDALAGRGATWLWPTSGVVTAAGRPGAPTTVVVMAQRMRRTGDGAWGFERTGMAAVTITVPWRGTPAVGRTVDIAAAGTAWGASLVRDGAVTWIYGTRDVRSQLGRDLLLARAPTASVTDRRTWTYRTAGGWSRSAAAAVPVRPASRGVSTVPSVVRLAGRWVVVTKAQEFLDPDVVALVAPHPWGPWTAYRLFSAPSTADVLRYSPAVVASSTGDRLEVAVSRTSPSLATLHAHAALAYPTFTDVAWGG